MTSLTPSFGTTRVDRIGNTPNYADTGNDQRQGPDQFAHMLDTAPKTNTQAANPEPATAKPTATKAAATKTEQSQGRQDAKQTQANDAASTRPAVKDQNDDQDDSTAETKASEGAVTSQAAQIKPAKAAKPEQKTETEHGPPSQTSWPPPGLGGFGMALLSQPSTAAPANTAATMPAGMLLATQAGTAAASALPLTASAPLTSSASIAGTGSETGPAGMGTAAINGSAGNGPVPGGLIPALATAAQARQAPALSTSDAQALPLAALALDTLSTNSDQKSGDAAPDGSVFVLPNTSPAMPNRLAEPNLVFSASPTPIPDLGSDHFDNAVATRLSWLADQKIGHAHIKITPNDMGPVEVRLQLDGDRINASFTATHADVRQALEQSIPRLRDMLGQHGFQLGQADVGQQAQSQPGSRPAHSVSESFHLEDAAPAGITPVIVLHQRGLLDTYA